MHLRKGKMTEKYCFWLGTIPGVIFWLANVAQAQQPGRLLSYEQGHQKISFACKNARLELKAVLPDVMNIKLLPKGKIIMSEKYVVEWSSWPKVELQTMANVDPVVIKSSNVFIRTFKNPFRLQFCDKN